MKNILSNKKGMGFWAIFGIAVLVLAIFGVGYAVIQSGKDGVSSRLDCENAPYFTLSGVNTTNPGDLLPSATYYHRLNGVYRGALTSGSAGTTFSRGDIVEILASISDHLDKNLGSFTVGKCASNDVSYDMYGTDAGTFEVWNSAGTQVTDATTGAVNQSAFSTPKTLELKLTSTAEDSIDATWITIEAEDTSQMDKIKLTAISSWLTIDDTVSNPDFFTSENTTSTSLVNTFRVSGLKPDGTTNEMSLRLEPESGQTVNGTAVYINGYTEQAFVERDGTFGIGIEDSDDNTKYEDTWDFDFCVYRSS